MMRRRVGACASLAQGMGMALLLAAVAAPWGCAPYPAAGEGVGGAGTGAHAEAAKGRDARREAVLQPGAAPPAPGALLLGGPYITVGRVAVEGAALGPEDAGFRIEEGEGVVLVMRALYDDPRSIDEEQRETLVLRIPSAVPGARRRIVAADLAYVRSTAWVSRLYASTGAAGGVEVLEAGDSGLLVRLDLEVLVRGAPERPRFPLKATLPFVLVSWEESRRR